MTGWNAAEHNLSATYGWQNLEWSDFPGVSRRARIKILEDAHDVGICLHHVMPAEWHGERYRCIATPQRSAPTPTETPEPT